jgi:aspartate carbamoyltransferase catalytic subunit
VLRHPQEGAARVAAQYADTPIINAGDGSHEHPTQTLCDLFTLRKELKMTSLEDFRDLNVVLYGDLKHGRTVHSLVFALARLGARIIPMAAKGFELPEHVIRRLQRDYGCAPTHTDDQPSGAGVSIDAIYVTPQSPHRRALWREVEELERSEELKDLSKQLKRDLSKIHVFYVTRLQTERLVQGADNAGYRSVDPEFLKEKRYKESRVLHPLPRVSELSYDLDNDPRGVYFQQAAYGVSVRMALMAWLLGLKPSHSSEAPTRNYPEYASRHGMRCSNPACITNAVNEQQHLVPAFWIVEPDEPVRLRCMYCEFEWPAGAVGKVSARKFHTDASKWKDRAIDDITFFNSDEEAVKAGFTPYKA